MLLQRMIWRVPVDTASMRHTLPQGLSYPLPLSCRPPFVEIENGITGGGACRHSCRVVEDDACHTPQGHAMCTRRKTRPLFGTPAKQRPQGLEYTQDDRTKSGTRQYSSNTSFKKESFMSKVIPNFHVLVLGFRRSTPSDAEFRIHAELLETTPVLHRKVSPSALSPAVDSSSACGRPGVRVCAGLPRSSWGMKQSHSPFVHSPPSRSHLDTHARPASPACLTGKGPRPYPSVLNSTGRDRAWPA